MKTLLVMAGGTGGHVYPALAVADSLLERGVRIVWLGTRAGLESRIELSDGIELEYVKVSSIVGVGGIRSIRSLLTLFRAFWQAAAVIRRRRPDALLGMGGYVSGPGALAGLIMRLPLIIHEANSYAGFTNRLLSRFATHVLTGFPDTDGLGRKIKWVGNPVRPGVVESASNCRQNISESSDFRLLIMGGSQGAEVLNRLVPVAMLMLPTVDRPKIIHQCGQAWYDQTASRYSELGIEANVVGYIEDVASVYKNSDLVICRAGAMTLAEITAVGAASLLVPFPHAAGNHQAKNAAFMAKRGAVRVIPQDQLSSETLACAITELQNDRTKLSELARAARSLACIDATEQVAGCCLEAMGA